MSWAVHANVIPHQAQRYNTVGDWEEGHFGAPHQIWVSACGNPDYEFLVMLHELVEFWLCHRRGISKEIVDAWDNSHANNDPGADPQAPYHREHEFACRIEELVSHEMGIELPEYSRALENLGVIE